MNSTTKLASKYNIDKSHYSSIIDQIIAGVESSNNEAYKRLEHLCITYGHRLTGTQVLNNAINWVYEQMKNDGLENVRKEEVQCPNWHRGHAHAAIIRHQQQHSNNSISNGTSGNTSSNSPPQCPYNNDLSDTDQFRVLHPLALGGSISDSVTAEVVEVTSFENLDKLGEAGKLRNKIVFYNVPFTTYGACAGYRWGGGSQAEKYGAIASIIRSIASESLSTPHTGTMQRCGIPAVAITIEDAELISRLINKKLERVTIHLCTHNTIGDDVIHHNVIGEIVGSEKADEIVVIGGHIDSWDVGQGAHDDGQGLINSWEVVRLLHKLNLRPKRTIRCVIWVDEEQYGRGCHAYANKYASDIDRHVAAIETDMGCYTSVGFGFTGSDEAKDIVQELLSLLQPLNATHMGNDGRGVDIEPLIEKSVPGFLLLLADEWFTRKYFAYHHTDADTIDKVDPLHMIQNVQVLTSFAYLLADVPFTLPRAKPTLGVAELPRDKLEAKMLKEKPPHVHGPHY